VVFIKIIKVNKGGKHRFILRRELMEKRVEKKEDRRDACPYQNEMRIIYAFLLRNLLPARRVPPVIKRIVLTGSGTTVG